MKYGSMERKRWKKDYGRHVEKCGEERNGQITGKYIVSIVNKGEGENVEDYRGVTLT